MTDSDNMGDTDWLPSSCKYCDKLMGALEYPVCKNPLCVLNSSPKTNRENLGKTVEQVLDKPVDDTHMTKGKPDGGPAEYYDLPPDAVTLNDLIEYKAYNSWLGDTCHLFNIFKACWRWGEKDGTSRAYDARKFIYSGARLLQRHAGTQSLRDLLTKMLNDKQFMETKK